MEMPGFGIIKLLLQQSIAHSSKSTVLRPLNWLLLILISFTLTSFYLELPNIICFTASIFTGLTIIIYLIVYFYCLFTDKDALRSETFIVQKLAIEKGIIGDNLTGKIDLDIEEESKRLPKGASD